MEDTLFDDMIPIFPVIISGADPVIPPARQDVNFNSGWRYWRGGSKEDNTPGTDANFDDNGSNWYRV